MSQSESIAELAAALAAVQGKLRGYAEDSDNPFFSSKYGDLTSVWAAIREPLATNGLSVVQTCDDCDDPPLEVVDKNGNPAGHAIPVIVVTTLLHTSGEWISGRNKMQPTKPGPQATTSAITYARRSGLAAIVGVAPADDDGEGATDHKGGRKAKPAVKKAAPKQTPKTAPQKSPADMLKTRHAAIMARHKDVGESRLLTLLKLCKEWNGGKSDGVTLDTWLVLIGGAEKDMTDKELDECLRYSDAGEVNQVGNAMADYFRSNEERLPR